MARKKNTETQNTEEDLFAQVAEETGGDVLGKIDSVKYFIDTGNLAVNYICSGKFIKGGIPADKITEIYGGSSSGKSLVASNVLYGCQKLDGWPVILDCENATNGEFMEKTSHLNLNKVLRYTPMTLEEAFLRIHTVTRRIREVKGQEVPIVVVYDSISASPCERELKETNLPQGYKPSDWKKIVGRNEQPGERAKVCSREMRKLQPMLEKNNVTVFITNQTRERIVMFGDPVIPAGGGNALPFYASCRLRSSAKKKIENKRLETFAGVNLAIKNVKNRTFKPFVDSEGIQLFFDTGINPVSGLLSCLLESERVVGTTKGNFSVLPAYLPAEMDEYKFRASKDRNDVPVEVVRACPLLIDASSSEEVSNYLSSFMAAIADSSSSDFEEKAIAFDEEGNALEEEVA